MVSRIEISGKFRLFLIKGIEIPVPMPEIQDIASLSGPTSENDSTDAVAVTLTGTIGLPTVAMVITSFKADN